MIWFFKKGKDVDYTIYEADEYYAETYEDEDSASSGTPLFFSTKIALVVMGYVFFLVIGIFSTSFITNPITGHKEAQIITVQLREERRSYALLKEHYLIIRDLLQKTQEIDNDFQKAEKDQSFVYATKYESLLPLIDQNIPRAKGLAVDSKYRTLLNQVVNIYTNDLPIYLQKMATALSQQDQTTFLEAMSWREQTIEDFERLRENMKAFAGIVKLEDKDLEQPVPLLPFQASGK